MAGADGSDLPADAEASSPASSPPGPHPLPRSTGKSADLPEVPNGLWQYSAYVLPSSPRYWITHTDANPEAYLAPARNFGAKCAEAEPVKGCVWWGLVSSVLLLPSAHWLHDYPTVPGVGGGRCLPRCASVAPVAASPGRPRKRSLPPARASPSLPKLLSSAPPLPLPSTPNHPSTPLCSRP